MSCPEPGLFELSPEAARFLDLLHDLGHLDDDGHERVLSLLVSGEEGGGVRIGLDAVRRAAARAVFESEEGLDSEQVRLLRQEWKALFC